MTDWTICQILNLPHSCLNKTRPYQKIVFIVLRFNRGPRRGQEEGNYHTNTGTKTERLLVLHPCRGASVWAQDWYISTCFAYYNDVGRDNNHIWAASKVLFIQTQSVANREFITEPYTEPYNNSKHTCTLFYGVHAETGGPPSSVHHIWWLKCSSFHHVNKQKADQRSPALPRAPISSTNHRAAWLILLPAELPPPLVHRYHHFNILCVCDCVSVCVSLCVCVCVCVCGWVGEEGRSH